MLHISRITKILGGRCVLDELALDAAEGELVALFGENGAGKSTLLRILAGVLDPDGGEASLDGESLLGPTSKVRARAGYVPEAADAPPHLSPRELVSLVAALKRAPLPAQSLLGRLAVSAYWDRAIGGLSLGQRRRSCLAAALVGDVRLLLLDEPTNGLDPGGVRELAQILLDQREVGTITLVATHDHAFAAMLGAREIRLSSGRIGAASAT
jgi:ABC-type multidrug transport system ATPase subunit